MHAFDATAYEDMVRRIAVRTMATLGMKDAIEDAVNDGYAALMEAHYAYEPERNVPFEAYAAYRIRWGILDRARKGASGRNLERLRHAMATADAEAERAGIERYERGEPTAVGSALGELEGVMNNLGMVFSAIEVAAAAQEGGAEDSLATELDAARLNRAIGKLGEDERRVLFDVYYEGIPVAEAGKTLKLSRASAYRLHSQALASLRALLV